jgi:DNA polymerase-3 subunit beta
MAKRAAAKSAAGGGLLEPAEGRPPDFTVPLEPFRRAWALAGRVVPTKPFRPILRNVCLDLAVGAATLRATDLEVAIEHRIALDYPGPERSLLLPKTLLDAILAVADGATLRFWLDGPAATVRSATADWSLTTEPVEQFPPPRRFAAAKWHEVEADRLAQALKRVTLAAGEGEYRGFTLSNVAVEPLLTAVSFTALTSSSLASQTIEASPVGGAVEAGPPYLMPAAVAEVLGGAVAKHVGPVQLAFPEPAWLEARFGATTLAARLAEGNFPQWRRFVPEGPVAHFTSAAGPVRQALGRAMTHLSEKTRSVLLWVGVHAEEPEAPLLSRLNFECENEHGGSESELTVAIEGDWQDLGELNFNPTTLSRQLAELGDATATRFEFHRPGLPIVLRVDDGFVGLVQLYGEPA